MRVRQLNEEVLFAEDQIVKVGREDIDFLKERAGHNQRKRIRLCAHRDVEDKVHEMFIVLTKDTYIRPHKHLNKSESLQVIEGLADAVVFDDHGNIIEVIPMGDYSSGGRFYYRISDPYYHTLLITSDFLVFHEVIKGPFKSDDTVFAPWSPGESDSAAGKGFMEETAQAAKSFLLLGKKRG